MDFYYRVGRYSLYLLSFLLLLVFTRIFLFQIYRISGNSMLPTLKHGDIVLVYKYKFPQKLSSAKEFTFFGRLKVNRLDQVLFEAPNGDYYVKRIIGLPGDFYAFRGMEVLIDSKPLNETYILRPENFPILTPKDMQTGNFYNLLSEGRIPPGYYLLLGDNRKISYDSRDLGLIPEERLRGKVVYVFSL
ncbi:MAG TPA: signal peptidase I [Leptospiraceae bacterium]|nr:signal peptidase I [Leptospiraceae bacterium]HMY65102.1 signal peptidase I [Leptospiraceae bacterium]HNF12523.1 signal peptidase I [Leptospiraceae bacterium]HNF24198.1 signal peptidase I [Leptospiraceae bacterium]HNI95919.1 signal peptidase I [Leptospiraceae bacterium]